MEKLNAMKMKRKESTGVEAKRQKDTIARAYAELKKEYASGNINLGKKNININTVGNLLF